MHKSDASEAGSSIIQTSYTGLEASKGVFTWCYWWTKGEMEML